GQNREQRITLNRMAHVNSRKRDGRSGVSANGLGQDAAARSFRELLAQGHSLLGVGHRPDVTGEKQWPEPRYRLLQHGGFAHDVEQLLWRACAAARPKARAASPGEDDGVGT